jgi:hypothetical protein
MSYRDIEKINFDSATSIKELDKMIEQTQSSVYNVFINSIKDGNKEQMLITYQCATSIYKQESIEKYNKEILMN